eukprot:CAMPEP_0181308860 /NCGR_PEP_ID=MMETSP1101-20121128/11703_1 /TAXON_ID=46948 /ORGANISM="Rhodomonas abbreviata, Strain Caron Lab Isolate" /LENGTH=79 /DNA_ID=CAMNT_0023415301 /DNA_START=63 /DNA_END=302 /DNA_ORIENTATION=+
MQKHTTSRIRTGRRGSTSSTGLGKRINVLEMAVHLMEAKASEEHREKARREALMEKPLDPHSRWVKGLSRKSSSVVNLK